MTDETLKEKGTREFSLEGFSEVDVSSAVEFEITQAAGYSVRVTGDEKLVESLKVDVSGQTLRIGLGSGPCFWGGFSDGRVKAIITMPELRKLTASGAARGTARGFKSDQDFGMELSGASQAEVDIAAGKVAVAVSGAGRVSGDLKAGDTELKLSGASRCKLSGTGGDTRLESSGASRADLSQFQTRNTDVSVSGAGKARINMNGTLNAELSGAASLEYTGEVVMGNRRVTGASKIRHA